MDIMIIAEIGCAIVTAASGICALTPTPSPASALGKVYRVVETLGLVVGKAKQSGLVPDNPALDQAAAEAIQVAKDLTERPPAS